MKYLFFFWVILVAVTSSSDELKSLEHQLVKRVVVFPFAVLNTKKEAVDKAWWAVREELTRSKRFTVASRFFLQKKEVFQERSLLDSVDVLLLGRLLESHALVTVFLEDQLLKMNVYEARTGRVLWKNSVFIESDLPLEDQLIKKAQKLTRSLVADFPYQGYQAGLSQEGDVTIAKVFVGRNHQIQVGDDANWVLVKRDNFKPLFNSGSQSSVIANGKVINLEDEYVNVEVTSVSSQPLEKYSLLFFEKEYQRLQNEFSLNRSPEKQLLQNANNFKAPEKKEVKNKSLVTVLSFLASFVLILAL